MGFFITFEGPDGGGKSTQIGLLATALHERGYRVLQTREPGGTEIGDQIRAILHDVQNTAMHARTEILLYSASRSQLVHERLQPHLAAGGIILSDRYADSTMAYQGYGRGLDLDWLRQITEFATGGLRPDLTLYFDIPVGEGLRRRLDNQLEWNRLDRETLSFHERVRDGYRRLMAAEPDRWVQIDAAQPVAMVQQSIWAIVISRLQAIESQDGDGL